MGSQSKKMNMRIILLFTIIGSSLAFSIDLDRALALPRSLCCLTINAQTTCATQCSGKSCSATCTVRCGILMSTCGTYTCSAVAASTCTTTAAPTTAAAATTTAAATSCINSGASCAATTDTCCTSGQTCQTFTGGAIYCLP